MFKRVLTILERQGFLVGNEVRGNLTEHMEITLNFSVFYEPINK